MPDSDPADLPVLVTGATGYVGGRLVPRLLEAGHRVRCLVRSPRKLESRPWIDDPDIEIVAADLEDAEASRNALQGCRTAYYLVHSMVTAGADYAERDRALAAGFAQTAKAAGIERIVYLGGLGETGGNLSEHLSSRREVEAALASGGIPVTVLRAAMIVGSGSASFEILRYLVERLPVMITPRWVHTRCQPVAIRDVLRILVECLGQPATAGRTFELGGPEVLSYLELIQMTAEVRGLPRRIVIPVPVLTPRLSALWIHLVTPIDARLARPLTEGLKNEVVCHEESIHTLVPGPRTPIRDAIRFAHDRTHDALVETRWSDAGAMPGDPDWAGGKTFVDPREIEIAAPPAAVYAAVCRVGGGHGWYAGNWLWRLRGWMDKLVGGPGLRRGRKDPEQVAWGEALDFWRVTDLAADRRLELRAEMRLPGTATLEFAITPTDTGSRLRQTARFKPKGLLGLAYWYAVLPLHGYVFRGMLRGIDRTARRLHREGAVNRPEPDPAPERA